VEMRDAESKKRLLTLFRIHTKKTNKKKNKKKKNTQSFSSEFFIFFTQGVLSCEIQLIFMCLYPKTTLKHVPAHMSKSETTSG